MQKREPYQNRIALLQGTLDLLILQTLQWAPQHGYGISQAIRANSGQAFDVDTGSLYPALHRLERERWISSEWKVSDNKQRVKVYRLTATGKKQLAFEHSRWSQLVAAMTAALNPAKEG
jgi:PadR family transcriptional regulator, regulatory protein PadR